MPISIQQQKGYLAIVAGLLIVTVGFMSLVTSYIFGDKATSIQQGLTSMQAYYIAQAGMERAIYYITTQNLSCSNISGNTNLTPPNTTFPGLPGQFSVTSTSSAASTSLKNPIIGASSSSSFSIQLTSNIANFTPPGTMIIDAEYINYTSINSTNSSLTGITRGSGLTDPTDHYAGAVISQNQCIFTVVGEALSTTGKVLSTRTTNVTLVGSAFAIGPYPGIGPGSFSGSSIGINTVLSSALMSSIGQTFHGGVNIINPNVHPGPPNTGIPISPNFYGSTILSGGAISLLGSSQTQVDNAYGTVMPSSTSSTPNAGDIYSNYPSFTSPFFNNFFTTDQVTMVKAATTHKYTSCLSLNGINGEVMTTSTVKLGLVKNRAITCSGSITIGSSTSPVVLIVFGNMTITGNTTINGFVFLQGTLNISTGSSLTINGALAIKGPITPTTQAVKLTVVYNPGILAIAATLPNSNAKTIYSYVPTNQLEQFS